MDDLVARLRKQATAVQTMYGEMATQQLEWIAADEIERLRSTRPEAVESDLPNAIWLAKFCHDAYERLAPQYGYETRQDTRTFDHESPNGRLMAAVFEELRATLLPSPNAALNESSSKEK